MQIATFKNFVFYCVEDPYVLAMGMMEMQNRDRKWDVHRWKRANMF